MKQYRPMLARSEDTPFSSDDWIFEIKWDGIRAISYVDARLSIRSRNHKELLGKFPELAEIKELCSDVVVDGEIIVMKSGIPDFQTLIQRSQTDSSRDIEYMAREFPATYVVFDILEQGGSQLLDFPLIDRKKVLKESVREGKYIVLSLFVEGAGESYFSAVLDKGLEGVMAKQKQSVYEPGRRSDKWLKIKKVRTCDCVIFGFTRGEGSREQTFGSLILGLYDGPTPVFVGKVGTGFSDEFLEQLSSAMEPLRVEEQTLAGVEADREVVWIRPILVCEVGYQSVTRDFRLRIPVFRGLKVDKTPDECTVEQIRPAARLQEYRTKRDFTITPEPAAGVEKKKEGNVFVIHEHESRRLHYDLRLEREGVLKSWAVPKGPPLSPGDKRLAVQTEDHPLEYGKFEGTIPEGQYGAGTVKIWDRGLYEPLVWEDDKIEILMKGDKLEGRYLLVKFRKAGEKDWLFFKAGE